MSSIKLRKLQIGLSNDASKNVTLFQSDTEDGVLRFGTGDESSLTEAFSIDNSGNLSLSSANLSSSDVSDFDSAAKNAVDKTHVDGLGVDAGTVGGLSTTELWHVGNDGAGSGLDADTIDGLESIDFATASQGNLADTAVQPGESITVPDGGTIGSTTTTDAVTISSTGNIGINYFSPESQLHVHSGAENVPAKFYLSNGGTDGFNLPSTLGELWFGSSEGSGWEASGIKGFGTADFDSLDYHSSLAFFTTPNGSVPQERMSISDAGDVFVDKNIFTPNRPAFWVTEAGEITTTTSAVVFSEISLNVGNNYNSSNGRFTAPHDGVYVFFGSGLNRQEDQLNSSEISFYKNGANINSRGLAYHASGEANSEHDQMTIQIVINLNAGDYITLGIYSVGGDIYFRDGLGYFMGYFLG